MKLGVNNDVNQGTKKAALNHMDGGKSKIKPPNSHPSNPTHKQATQAQGTSTKQPTKPTTPTQTTQPTQPSTDPPIDPHHVNKALVAVGVLAVAGFIAWMR